MYVKLSMCIVIYGWQCIFMQLKVGSVLCSLLHTVLAGMYPPSVCSESVYDLYMT